MKKYCQDVAKSLVHELEVKYSNIDPMLALGVIYLNFGLIAPIILKMFSTNTWLPSKLPILCLTRWQEGVFVKPLLHGHALDVQCYFKKMTMATNRETIIKEDSHVNLVNWLWVKFSFSSILKLKFSKFIKLVEIARV